MKHATIPNYFNNYSLEVGTVDQECSDDRDLMIYLAQHSGPFVFNFTMTAAQARAMAYALAVAADNLEDKQ